MEPLTAITIGSSLLGAFAGAQKSPDTNKYSNQTVGMNLAPETGLEKQGLNLQQQQIANFQNSMAGIGTQQQFNQGYFNQANQYANILGQYAQTGGAASRQDLTAGQQYAQQLTAPLQQQADLEFKRAQQQYAANAALQGRGLNDFTFQNRLNQMRQEQMNQIGAQQQAIGAQYAQQLGQNRLGYMGQLTDLKSNLATQTMQNRMAIMSLGSQLQSQERNFRLNTATKTIGGNESVAGQEGGLMGGLTGGLMGAKFGLGLKGLF